ncbi:MAG: transglycosylase domain-containing protein [Hyphomicrobiaceae bacterium]|nr:transglycosylase domain-containing protein [Hyphomicrobiaceae bacterium]
MVLGILVAAPLFALILFRYVDPTSVPMLSDRLAGMTVAHRFVPLEDVAPPLVWSVIAAEDQRFCSHGGVDWDALFTQVDRLRAGEDPRGASTLTMQVVKNLFFGTDRSYVRKVLEVPLALAADIILGKERVFEIYVNIAEWGEGIYGVEAAAQAYFRRPARDLTLRDAARLASALPNPQARNPANPTGAHRRLAGIVEGRAPQMGAYITCILGEG